MYGSSSSLIKCLWVGEGKGHLVTLTTLRGSYHPHQRRNCCWNGCQLFEKLESNWMRKANLQKNLTKKQAERIPVKVILTNLWNLWHYDPRREEAHYKNMEALKQAASSPIPSKMYQKIPSQHHLHLLVENCAHFFGGLSDLLEGS